MAAGAVAVAGALLSPDMVASKFVEQYYQILERHPELAHKFYQDYSFFGRPDSNGNMISIYTMAEIEEKIKSMEHVKWTIKTVDAQQSLGGGLVVLVRGYLTGMDKVDRDFTQSFFLAPHDTGFFVLNDIFRYEGEEDLHQDCHNFPSGTDAPREQNGQALERMLTGTMEDAEANRKELHDLSNSVKGLVVKEEALGTKVIDDGLDNFPPMVVNSSFSDPQELTGTKDGPPMSVPAHAPAWPAPRKTERYTNSYPAPAAAFDMPTPSSSSVEKRNTLEAEVDGHSVYLRCLPMDATPAQLEEELKKFGPIKPNGIQIRNNKIQGFCYGFVEFEVASAVLNAIKASPIFVGGCQVFVEEKRASNSRAINRGRFAPSRGGVFRNEGGRGHGSYGGGKDHARGDLGNRPDFGIRTGGGREDYSSRGDRY